ncbi:MAG: ATP-binding protein [Geminicoccaceae bacterium]|nr:ATP-binding protein [Geminicoccaceae bacterium]
MPENGGTRGSLRGRFDSLQARMALILGIVLIPPMLYSTWQAYDAWQAEGQQRTELLGRMIAVISAYEDDFFARAEDFLSRTAGALVASGADCDAALSPMVTGESIYHAFLLTNAEGQAVCATDPGLREVSIADRPYFHALRAGVPFAVSGLLQSPVRSDPIIVVAHAIRAGGAFEGALSASINLDAFATSFRRLDLPKDAVIHIVDRNGQPIEGTSALVAQLPAAPALAGLMDDPRQPLEAAGRDGVRRSYLADPMAGGRLFVVGGVPQAGRWSWLQRELIIGIFAPTLMLALAVVAIWIASDYLVNRHVRSLAAAARAQSRGKTGTRLRILGAPTELHDLAATFNRMADRIQSREDQLKATIEQKEGLVREVHHRVKNNLQIVTSLLNLRARRAVSDEAREVLSDAQTRIRALALVHRSLYAHDEVRWLEFGGFVGELCAMLEDAGGAEEEDPIRLVVEAEPLHVTVDQAISLTLLLVEAVSNAYRHAFPGGREGRILVRLEGEMGKGRLTITDDGIGGTGGGAGMGLTLIRMFAKQIQGDLAAETEGGTRLVVTFPLVPVEMKKA